MIFSEIFEAVNKTEKIKDHLATIAGQTGILEFHDPLNGYYYNIVAFTTVINGEKVMITFYRNPKDPLEYGYEIYMGSNYIIGSNKRSYSKQYKKGMGLPKQYKKIAIDLEKIHDNRYNKENKLKVIKGL